VRVRHRREDRRGTLSYEEVSMAYVIMWLLGLPLSLIVLLWLVGIGR
jgi:hypothetical protein